MFPCIISTPWTRNSFHLWWAESSPHLLVIYPVWLMVCVGRPMDNWLLSPLLQLGTTTQLRSNRHSRAHTHAHYVTWVRVHAWRTRARKTRACPPKETTSRPRVSFLLLQHTSSWLTEASSHVTACVHCHGCCDPTKSARKRHNKPY